MARFWAIVDSKGVNYSTKAPTPGEVPRPCIFRTEEDAKAYLSVSTFSHEAFVIAVNVEEKIPGSLRRQLGVPPPARTRFERNL